MNVGGVSVVFLLGLVNGALLVFQLLSGLHVIKVGIGVHKKSGVILLCTAFILGLLAFMLNS
jgi:hypothetical protein